MQVGLGDVSDASQISIRVYIANRPPLPVYDELDGLACMQTGEIAEIGRLTGNHWRKIFNVYAKLMFEFIHEAKAQLGAMEGLNQHIKSLDVCSTWQMYRDHVLLQAGSNTGLLFSPPIPSSNTLHLIMAKGYAETLGYQYEPAYLEPNLSDNFACYEADNVILCPYFDYRQLSNQKITSLVGIMLRVLKSNNGYLNSSKR